jgi:hypothetical protein
VSLVDVLVDVFRDNVTMLFKKFEVGISSFSSQFERDVQQLSNAGVELRMVWDMAKSICPLL